MFYFFVEDRERKGRETDTEIKPALKKTSIKKDNSQKQAWSVKVTDGLQTK